MRYYSVQCPNCGKWQSCEVKQPTTYTFKCRTCGKSRKLHKKRELGLTLKTINCKKATEAARITAHQNNNGKGAGKQKP